MGWGRSCSRQDREWGVQGSSGTSRRPGAGPENGPEQAEEVLLDLGDEVGQRQGQPLGGERIDGREVGRMVEWTAGRDVAEGEAVEGVGEELVGSVRLDEEAVRGDVAEGLPLAEFSFVGEVAGEREVGAESGKGPDHLRGSAVGVEEEAGGWTGAVAEQVVEATPGLEAMDRRRQVAVGGEGHLEREGLLLGGRIGVGNPAVKADFAHGGGEGVEVVNEVIFPGWSAFADGPGMIAEGGEDIGTLPGDFEDSGPVGLARSVDDQAAEGAGAGEDVGAERGEAFVVEMIMGVEEPFRGRDGRLGALDHGAGTWVHRG